MNKTLLSIALLLLSVAANATTAASSAALTKARQFLDSRGVTAELTEAVQATTRGQGAHYTVYNVGDRQGFVIMTAGETPLVAGYVDEGRYDAEALPAGLRAWLAGSSFTAQSALRQTRAEAERQDVAPIVASVWSQDSPFANRCPAESPTGCVATAMAQVMYHYRWPEQTAETIPAYTTRTNGYTLSAQPVTTLSWGDMVDNYDQAGITDTQREAVALLMLLCGQSVDMDYDDLASSASSSKVALALRQYFGYSASAREVFRTDYSISQWDELLYEEVFMGRPVIYGGVAFDAASGSMGHQFIVDGYEAATGLYHVNWGWGGFCNGLFAIAEANPNGTGIGGAGSYEGYSMSQTATIGITPDKGQEAPQTAPNMAITSLGLPAGGTFSRNVLGSTVKWSMRIENHAGQTVKGSVSLGFYQGGELVKQFITIGLGENGFAPGTYSASDWEGKGVGRGLSAGSYTVKVVYRPDAQSDWRPLQNSDRYYFDAEVTESGLTLVAHPEISLRGYGHAYAEVKDSDADELRIGIENLGDEFNGNLYLLVNGAYRSAIGYQQAAHSKGIACFHYERGASESLIQVTTNITESGWRNGIIYEAYPADVTDLSTGIATVRGSRGQDETHYNLRGRQISAGARGLHLVKGTDGTVRKVIVR